MLSKQMIALAILRVGETQDPPGLLQYNVYPLAHQYDGLDATLPDGLPGISLEDLYVRKALAEIALGACRAKVQAQTAGGAVFHLEHESVRLVTMIATLTAEIARVEDQAKSYSSVEVGQLAATELIDPPYVGSVDASWRRYRGDPYIGTTRRTPW